MSIKLVHNNYGKSRIRLLKVARRGELQHEIQEVTVKITFEGDFDDVHIKGDNKNVLPTDTMKNTVYALAHQTQEIEEIETFAQRLADHFLKNNEYVTQVTIDIAEHNWSRIKQTDSTDHPHAFIGGSDERHTTTVCATRDLVTIESGIVDLIVLKTTRSGFAGFVRDAYTTLPEATDRIFSTSIKAVWQYTTSEAATEEIRCAVRSLIIGTFSEHDSLSVQHTLYAMGEAVLEKFSEIAEISFSLPNIHYIPLDMSRIGLDNDNRILLPTDEPHGLIEARIKRT